MGYQVPRDLIEQARILLRKEAGFRSYNPSVPPLPVEDVIAGIDSSPDSVRCIQCKGNLLRGSQSLICVYCGRQLHREILPDPISFKATIGFRWLIESLSLDGSEIVEPSEEKRQINRGRNSGKDEISLSDFLNLDMTWPAESERFGLSEADEFRIQRSRQLAGMSLILTCSEEGEKPSEAGNHHLSENQELFGVKPSEVKHDDSFSVWEADFAAAPPVASHDYTESPHPVDYTSHIDSVFEPVKDVEEGKPKHDPFSNVQHHEPVVPDHDLQLGRQQDEGLESDHADSKSVTDMTNDQGLTSSSTSVWNDFTSSNIVSDGQLASMFGPWNDVNTKEKKDSGEIVGSTETDKHNDSVMLSSDNSSLPDTIVDSTVDTTNKKHEDPLDLFMGSTVPQQDHGAGGHLNTEADGWDDFMSLTKSSISEKNTKIDKDIDSWNAFTGSASRPENKSANEDMAWAWTDISNQNIQQETIDQRAFEHKAVVQDENSPTSWFDFSASGNIVSNKDQTSSSFNNVTSADLPNQLFEDFPSSNEVKVDDVLNSWMGFTNSSGLLNNQCQTNEAHMSEDLSMGLDSVPAIMKNNENDDSFDGWSDFKSSTNMPGNEFRNESQVDDKHAVVRDGPYDAWNLFTSSYGSQRNVGADEDANQVSLFALPCNMKSDSFNSTLHPVIFPAAASNQNETANIDISSSETLDSFRLEDGNARSSIHTEQIGKVEDVANRKAIYAEALISQMQERDISFMLESNLSVPKK